MKFSFLNLSLVHIKLLQYYLSKILSVKKKNILKDLANFNQNLTLIKSDQNEIEIFIISVNFLKSFIIKSDQNEIEIVEY